MSILTEMRHPSGWMGDWDDVTFNDSYTTDPHSGANCIKITYSANGSQGYNWSGIYWQLHGMALQETMVGSGMVLCGRILKTTG